MWPLNQKFIRFFVIAITFMFTTGCVVFSSVAFGVVSRILASLSLCTLEIVFKAVDHTCDQSGMINRRHDVGMRQIGTALAWGTLSEAD